MQRFAMVVSVVFVLLWSALGHAADTGSAKTAPTSSSLNVVMTARPYFTARDREEFTLKHKAAYLMPVGIMIRNLGKNPVAIEGPFLKTSVDELTRVKLIIPYRKAPAGAVAGLVPRQDALKLTHELDANLGMASAHRVVRMNEIFSCQWVKPNEDCYGLVYLDHRNSTLHPAHLNDLSGIVLEVGVVDPDAGRAGQVELALGEELEGRPLVHAVPPTAKNDANEKDGLDLLYIGPEGSKPTMTQLFRTYKAISDCVMQVRGKETPPSKWTYKRYAIARMTFNRAGKRLEATLPKPSRYAVLDTYALKVVKKVETCSLPAEVVGKASPDDEAPAFQYDAMFGDLIVFDRERAAREASKAAMPSQP